MLNTWQFISVYFYYWLGTPYLLAFDSGLFQKARSQNFEVNLSNTCLVNHRTGCRSDWGSFFSIGQWPAVGPRLNILGLTSKTMFPSLVSLGTSGLDIQLYTWGLILDLLGLILTLCSMIRGIPIHRGCRGDWYQIAIFSYWPQKTKLNPLASHRVEGN